MTSRVKSTNGAVESGMDDTLAPMDVMQTQETLTIRPLNFRTMIVRIRGTAPYMQLRFSEKAKRQMRDTQLAGHLAKGKRERKPRDFDEDYEGAMHYDSTGQNGIPAAAFRNAMIDACRMVGYAMTRAKMSVFVEADALDEIDGTPLVTIFGTPERTESIVLNATGVADIRVRPMWRDWSCVLHLSWDADQFGQVDVLNLLNRAGRQVGVGEGRPYSKKSAGLGFGTFALVADTVEIIGG